MLMFFGKYRICQRIGSFRSENTLVHRLCARSRRRPVRPTEGFRTADVATQAVAKAAVPWGRRILLVSRIGSTAIRVADVQGRGRDEVLLLGVGNALAGLCRVLFRWSSHPR